MCRAETRSCAGSEDPGLLTNLTNSIVISWKSVKTPVPKSGVEVVSRTRANENQSSIINILFKHEICEMTDRQ